MKASVKTILDDFDQTVLRKYIANFHITMKHAPMVKRILQIFTDENGYTGKW